MSNGVGVAMVDPKMPKERRESESIGISFVDFQIVKENNLLFKIKKWI